MYDKIYVTLFFKKDATTTDARIKNFNQYLAENYSDAWVDYEAVLEDDPAHPYIVFYDDFKPGEEESVTENCWRLIRKFTEEA